MAALLKNAEHIFSHKVHDERTLVRFGEPLDVVVKFIQDLHTLALHDPYFIANIDSKAYFVSTAQRAVRTLAWNDYWMIANVPSDAQMTIKVYAIGTITDELIGSFTIGLSPGISVQTIRGNSGTDKGSFGLQVSTEQSQHTDTPQCSFNGPIRYSRHFSPTAGALTSISAKTASSTRLWSTWEISLKGVHSYFGNNHQHWNVNYHAAQTIFQGPLSFTIRAPIEIGHHMLYARNTTSSFGAIHGSHEFWALFRAGDDRPPNDPLLAQLHSHEEQRIKPAVYTYIIGEDDVFRFSETGASFFVDFASKHAVHSCCAETIRYSGEFHPRPVYPDDSGWASHSNSTADHDVEWELVIDNASGTYAPDKTLLGALAGLLEHNFPGLRVVAYDFKDDELEKSRSACRAYAKQHRGIPAAHLQPTPLQDHEQTSLFKAASSSIGGLTTGLAHAADGYLKGAKGPGSVGGGVVIASSIETYAYVPSTSASNSADHFPATSSSSLVPSPAQSPQQPLVPNDAPPAYSEMDGEPPYPQHTTPKAEHRPPGW